MKNIDIYKEKVNLSLKNFLERKLEKDGKYSKETKELIEHIIEYNLRGGKRIRPLATIFAYKCFKNDEKIIDASIFIELIQAYLLIHDDIMDKSDLRRGKETMHKIYEKEYGEHFGKSIAILAGNLCASYSYESILESSFNDKNKLEAIKYINWIIERENYGQALDILPGFKNLKEEDVMKIYELKTATYTFQGPIYIGSILANASSDKIKNLQEYSYNLGIAFQIQDDLNGIFSETDKLGKPNSDIKEGKKTLIIAKTLELCSPKEREFILKEYGNEKISDESVEKIKEIIKKCGSYDYCRNKLNELTENAKKLIINVELQKEGKDSLIELADYIKSLF
jgi:geranylgeranyl diphosphate synthase, type I